LSLGIDSLLLVGFIYLHSSSSSSSSGVEREGEREREMLCPLKHVTRSNNDRRGDGRSQCLCFLGVKLRMEYEKIVFDKVIDLVLDVFLIN
jgi:hypothetical protein